MAYDCIRNNNNMKKNILSMCAYTASSYLNLQSTVSSYRVGLMEKKAWNEWCQWSCSGTRGRVWNLNLFINFPVAYEQVILHTGLPVARVCAHSTNSISWLWLMYENCTVYLRWGLTFTKELLQKWHYAQYITLQFLRDEQNHDIFTKGRLRVFFVLVVASWSQPLRITGKNFWYSASHMQPLENLSIVGFFCEGQKRRLKGVKERKNSPPLVS